MNLNIALKKKNMSKYALSKRSGISYSTIHDLCSGIIKIQNLSSGLLYRISKVLGIPMEQLLEEERTQEYIRSEICHELKELGDFGFMEKVIKDDRIENAIDNDEIFEALYTLALIDYLCNKYGIPIIEHYSELREKRFKSIVYPAGMMLKSKINGMSEKEMRKNLIPEFLNFNIAEEDVYNVA